MSKSDLRLKCARCKHVQRFHKDGGCRAAGCKGCEGFYPDEVVLSKKNPRGLADITPRMVAEHLASNDKDMVEMFYAEVIWNPGYYYRTYLDLNGFLSMDAWLNLCKKERSTTKG